MAHNAVFLDRLSIPPMDIELRGTVTIYDCFFHPASGGWTDDLKAQWRAWRLRQERPQDHPEEPWSGAYPFGGR